jgi:hypothetical protein
MYEHHRRAIDKVIAHFQDDPKFPALIIAGSIAKGLEREDSDVDVILVATDEEYATRAPAWDLAYYSTDSCDYEGGYVDGKICDLQFLRDVADHGSDPARAAFEGAWIGYSRIPELADILSRIPVYPEHEHQERIRSFYAQVEAWRWYVGEAEKWDDRYLLMHTTSQLALFSGRMILAHNRILYPYHKWFMHALRDAPDKPEDFLALIDDLLEHPGKANADALCESLFGFQEWDKPSEGWAARFMKDSEWNWRDGQPPIGDW